METMIPRGRSESESCSHRRHCRSRSFHGPYQCDLTHLLQHPVVGQLALGVGVGHRSGCRKSRSRRLTGLILRFTRAAREDWHTAILPRLISGRLTAPRPTFQRIRHSLLAPVADRRGLGHVPVVGQGEQGQVQVPVEDRSHCGHSSPGSGGRLIARRLVLTDSRHGNGGSPAHVGTEADQTLEWQDASTAARVIQGKSVGCK